MIHLTNVSKKYVKQTVLTNLSISLPIGKIIGIVGENGSGKSTILKLISGLAHPTNGNVTVFGEKANRRISKFVSYLSELGAYYSFFTVDEAMEFHASQFADFNMGKAKEIMSFMKLEPHMKIKNLSKGNRGRLKIMLTLAREVPYILMDEPLSGLDPMVRDAIVKGMISYMDLETQSLIMTSHEIMEIESLLDSFIAIKEGSILRMADVEELYESEGVGITDWMKKAYV
ncbi:spermidine/putrescine ABC transporter ATP-binding protein [Paenibacillus sp. Soil766]|uniref:ATP-binding cassette domain-containing protein n=1 Tax=Paenibacillus sp. Soil766 TaxID=1736404 RepID=UPI00070DECDF|nr:ABC transporter ATP-binding protein [Paenibacillus sp. Soil766]KRF04818.1 spermidine/putrescine ABC transporter ATP-binding protein [Paenibacillus sp. Soil766]